MPTVKPGSKVLVSGANGFIAVWLVRDLLEKGYAVRGTVRSEAKAKHLRNLFAGHNDKLELVVVEDITKDGAFDEAVKGVDAIEHTASPFYLVGVDDPQELIGPAVKGTVGILQSALKYGSAVKRVVVTSSCAAVMEVKPPPSKFSEENWNEQAIKRVEDLGKGAAGIDKYRASKTLAEKAAWAFVKDHKSEIGWDLVVLNPPYVFGPVLHEVKDAESLNTSAREFYNTILVEGSKNTETLLTQGSSWIDVRDLAEAHVLALEKEAAGGERIIVSAGPYLWQEWVDTAQSLQNPPIAKERLAVGAVFPADEGKRIYPLDYATEKLHNVLGMKTKTKAETVQAVLEDVKQKGW